MNWTENQSVSKMRADDMRREGIVFRHGAHLYRTTGRHLSHGGMGSVFVMERQGDSGVVEAIVGKVFHAQYLYQLRTDDVARRDYQTTLSALEAIRRIEHPNLLPLYVSERLVDNHLLISPRMADTLLEFVARGDSSPRHRVRLLIQALEGLCILHENRLIHRDFTLRNILVDAAGQRACLFDFDLALRLDDVASTTYGAHYQGRIFGSPGFSVAPELVDDVLGARAITPRLDVYAIGGALFRMFSDSNPHGPTDDMWGLLMRIGAGVVFNGTSHITYPDALPAPLRPIIERCLERDPGNRYGSVRLVMSELEQSLDALDDHEPAGSSFDGVNTVVPQAQEGQHRLRSLPGVSKLPNVTPGFFDLLFDRARALRLPCRARPRPDPQPVDFPGRADSRAGGLRAVSLRQHLSQDRHRRESQPGVGRAGCARASGLASTCPCSRVCARACSPACTRRSTTSSPATCCYSASSSTTRASAPISPSTTSPWSRLSV